MVAVLHPLGRGLRPSPDVLGRAAAIAAAGSPIGPDGCVCGAAKRSHAREDFTGPGPDGCPGYRPDPAQELAWAAVAADSRLAMADVAEHNSAVRQERASGRWQVSPSDVGSCPRRVWYRENPPAGYVPLPQDTRKADAGTAFHAGITEARAALYPWRQHKVRLRVPGLDRDGEGDEYDPITATLEDWKTAGPTTWAYIGVHGPWEKAWKQAFVYAYALAFAGAVVRRVRIRYIHRETGEEEVFTRAYDEAYALAALGELINLVTMIEAGLEPIRAGRGPDVDPLCDRCEARLHCWNIPAAKLAGRTPQTFTVHGPNPEPDDPELLWCIAEAGRARLERLALEKDEKAYKALADVDAGVYGEWEVKRGGSSRPQHRQAFDQLVEALRTWEETPADARPPVVSLIPAVRVARSRKLEIVPVRQASREKPVPIASVGDGAERGQAEVEEVR
ncbi:hypothetical protein AB0B10_25870 [Micromonospora arborensis]|uniref:hypothetical protein n=1 Tax=Micromonospora arborensis TaxID=2116518 RepID=UPI0033DBBE79